VREVSVRGRLLGRLGSLTGFQFSSVQPPRARGSLCSGLPPPLASGSKTSKISKIDFDFITRFKGRHTTIATVNQRLAAWGGLPDQYRAGSRVGG